MALNIQDGPDVLDDFISISAVKVDNEHFVVETQSSGSSDMTSRLIQTDGLTLTQPDTDVFTPSGNIQNFPFLTKLPDSDKYLSCQLTEKATVLSTLIRVGTVDTVGHTISMGAENELVHTGQYFTESPTVLGLSSTKAILFYTVQTQNPSLDYYFKECYRILTITGDIVSFGSEQTFKDHNSISGTTTNSYTGYVISHMRQIPDSSDSIYLLYKNSDTSEDGTHLVNAVIGTSLVINYDKELSTSEGVLSYAGDSAIAPLAYNLMVSGFLTNVFGSNQYNETGLLEDVSENELGFARITSNNFLLVTDGGANANVYIGTVNPSSYDVSVNAPLAVGASGNQTRGVFTSIGNTAVIFNDDFVVLIDSDSGQLDVDEFVYVGKDSLWIANGVLGTTLAYKSDCPFSVQVVEGMAVDDQMGKVFIGSKDNNSVVKLTSADDYSTEEDITDTLPDNTTYSLRRVK